MNIEKAFSGGDLRSIGGSHAVVAWVDDAHKFALLFSFLTHADRKVAMRAADAIEKITLVQPHFLQPHKKQLLQLCTQPQHIELKWHLALLAPRLSLTQKEREAFWQTLYNWVADKKESRIVRVNALDALWQWAQQQPCRQPPFEALLQQLYEEDVPSLQARLRKLQKRTETARAKHRNKQK